MTVEQRTPSGPQEWNGLIADAPGQPTMFQTHELATVKATVGWQPRFLMVDGVPVAVHTRTAPGFGRVWYAPKGPAVATTDQLAAILPALADAARRDGAFMLKIEPELLETPENLAALDALGLVPAGRIQTNRSTVLVDISGDADELLARLPSKTRNGVRRGMRGGVEVEVAPATAESYERMWGLWDEVAQDQSISSRGRDYQTTMWRTFCESGTGALIFATHEGKDVAAAFVTVVGEMACYKDGASVRERPVAGASQLLQYESMRWAQGRGATTYDMCGTPHSTKVDDKDDPYHGLGVFKRGFTKEVTDYVGALDLPLRPRRYQLWNKAGHRVLAKVMSRRAGASFF